jgi:transcriptional regulator PpsR
MAQPVARVPLATAQPDVMLVLDLEGVILEASLSPAVPTQDLKSWIGRPWRETVVDPGSAKVRRIVDDARSAGVSAFRQVNQRFPSGLELPIEYTAVRLGQKGLVAVGKSLQAVAELQSRLLAAQQAMERDYWKLRETETRCRLLFDRSNEATLWVKAANLRIVEANPAALRVLGLPAHPAGFSGRDLGAEVVPEDRDALEAMLHRVRDQGKAPGILARLGKERSPWLVRASLLPSHDGLAYLLQLTPASPAAREQRDERPPVEALVQCSPDGFVVLDRVGTVLRANRAFLDLVQVGAEEAVTGQPLARWLGRPGADVDALLAGVAAHGSVRLFATTLQGELGAVTDVELAAASGGDAAAQAVGVVIRDVASRLPEASNDGQLAPTLRALADRIGKTTLPVLVREAVAVVERHCIDEALERTAGNRTAAAQLLGLSRQSLYAKLNRYGFEGEAS